MSKKINEIVIRVKNLNKAVSSWQKIFSPFQACEYRYWQLGSGPGLRIIQGTEDLIEALELKVKSVKKLKSF